MSDCQYCGNYAGGVSTHPDCLREAERRADEHVCIRCGENPMLDYAPWCGSCGNDSQYKGYSGAVP